MMPRVSNSIHIPFETNTAKNTSTAVTASTMEVESIAPVHRIGFFDALKMESPKRVNEIHVTTFVNQSRKMAKGMVRLLRNIANNCTRVPKLVANW